MQKLELKVLSEMGAWTVLIPTLDEEAGIGLTICDILKSLGDPEIIVVDAHSTDQTPKIAARLGAKVIPQNGKGKGRAIAQVLPCINNNTEYLVMIDGDYTYPAKYIPQMIKILEENGEIDMVTGERFNDSTHSRMAYVKRLVKDPFFFGNQALAFLHRMLNRVEMKDPLTGLRVIKFISLRDFQIKAKSFDFEVELNHYIRQNHSSILEIPIEYRQRMGEKKLRMKHGFVILKRILVMAFEDMTSFLMRKI